MTAIKPREVVALLKSRNAAHTVILLYGLDQGLIRERASAFAHQVVDDPNDPFNAIDLTDQELSETTGRLADEVAALSFMGGERLIRIQNNSDAVAKAVDHVLKGIEDGHINPNALIVIEGGDLKKTNKLRKRCEQSPRAAAIGCYSEGRRDIATSARDLLADADIAIDDDALDYLAARLGEDRGITRSEIEKIILYAGPKSTRNGDHIRVTRDDVAASLVDSTTDSTFDIANAVLSGRPGELSERLFRAQNAGVSPMTMAVILQQRITRLLGARRHMANGMGANAAMKAMRPPIFFAEQDMFRDQLNRWNDRALAAAVRDLFEADLAAKQTGAPQREIIERSFLRLAVGASRRG